MAGKGLDSGMEYLLPRFKHGVQGEKFGHE